MGVWNVNLPADLVANAMVDSFSKTSNNNTGFDSDYAKILSQKIAQVENQSSSSNFSQIPDLTVANSIPCIETIKRFRPDGTITITTYEDGKVANLTKIKPHLVPTPDYSAPLTPEGHVAIKMEPHLSLMELLMI